MPRLSENPKNLLPKRPEGPTCRNPRITLEVIKNHHMRRGDMLIEIPQELDHAGALHKIPVAAHAIGEHGHNIMALGFCKITAAGFLRFQPVTLQNVNPYSTPSDF